MARSRGFRQAPQTRRRKGWEVGIGQVAPQTAITGSSSVIVTSGLQPTIDGLTLLRTRGSLLYFLSLATAALDGFRGAFGIGIVTSAAFTAGAASVPTPITEQGWDGWLFWHRIDATAASPIAGGVSADADALLPLVAGERVEIDSKAMRKVAQDETIFAAIELVEVGTATFQWAVDSRMLFALP